MNEKQKQFIRTLPRKVLLNYVQDTGSDELGMAASTFQLAMNPLFRKVKPMELWDFIVSVLRESVVRQIERNSEKS